MGHGLDAHLLLDDDAGEERAHPALRTRSVGDVHRIDTGVLQLFDVGDHARRIHTARRDNLDARDELIARDLAPPFRTLGECHGGLRFWNSGLWFRRCGLSPDSRAHTSVLRR